MVKKQPLIRKTSKIATTIIVIAVAIIVTILLSYYFIALLNNLPFLTIISPHNRGLDKFGIKEIYPTSIGGREWFINMDNPENDVIFNPESPLTRQPDGSWQIAGR